MTMIAFGFNLRSFVIGAAATVAGLCVYSNSMADAGKVSTPSPGQQANHEPLPKEWKTYANAAYHYRLHYPASAELDAHDPAHITISFHEPFPNGTPTGGMDELDFEVIVQTEPPGVSLPKWAHQQLGGEDDDNIQEEGPARVAGQAGYRARQWGADEGYEHYYVTRRGLLFDITYNDPATKGELTPSSRAHTGQILRRMLDSLTIE